MFLLFLTVAAATVAAFNHAKISDAEGRSRVGKWVRRIREPHRGKLDLLSFVLLAVGLVVQARVGGETDPRLRRSDYPLFPLSLQADLLFPLSEPMLAAWAQELADSAARWSPPTPVAAPTIREDHPCRPQVNPPRRARDSQPDVEIITARCATFLGDFYLTREEGGGSAVLDSVHVRPGSEDPAMTWTDQPSSGTGWTMSTTGPSLSFFRSAELGIAFVHRDRELPVPSDEVEDLIWDLTFDVPADLDEPGFATLDFMIDLRRATVRKSVGFGYVSQDHAGVFASGNVSSLLDLPGSSLFVFLSAEDSHERSFFYPVEVGEVVLRVQGSRWLTVPASRWERADPDGLGYMSKIELADIRPLDDEFTSLAGDISGP